MKKTLSTALSIMAVACTTSAFAGGPLFTYDDCKPVIYPASAMPIQYLVDQGSLGQFSNSQATAVVDECFAVWQTVPTVALSFQNAGFLPADITENNIEAFLDSIDGTNTNPVIFDSDGGIIDAVYGRGASDNIIGFSGSSCNDEYNCQYYTDGLSLLNGRFTQAPYYWTAAIYKATFVHEFGHFIGLDHTQINKQYVHNDNTADDIYIPTMYPTATDDDTPLGNLNPDDEAAVTMLYPADTSVVNAVYGKIKGTLLWRSGRPARGANVIAIKQGDEQMSQFSSVSDYCLLGDGSFEMLVTPGTYTFKVEPINPHFYGGSSVGPYAATPLSRSFIFPAVTQTYEESLTVAAGETKTVELEARRNWLRPLPGITARLIEILQNLGILP